MADGTLAVYGKREDGEMQLIKRGLTAPEAIKTADKHYHDTGRTAVIVRSEPGGGRENGRL